MLKIYYSDKYKVIWKFSVCEPIKLGVFCSSIYVNIHAFMKTKYWKNCFLDSLELYNTLRVKNGFLDINAQCLTRG